MTGVVVRRGRKAGIIHELRCISFKVSDFVGALRCEQETRFGELSLYGPSQIEIVDDPVDCMACIAARVDS